MPDGVKFATLHVAFIHVNAGSRRQFEHEPVCQGKMPHHACLKGLSCEQVRCMAAVLLMVGRQLEEPEVVQQMLDIQQTPCKPQYNYASEVRADALC